jgi:hypothetical protein
MIENDKKNKTIDQHEKLCLELEERVKCPVCLEVPTAGPIYSCPSGHTVCSTCYQGQASNCPLCRTMMYKNTSLIGMTVIENIEHICRLEGCTEKIPLDQVETHRKACLYRPITCPAILCQNKIAYNHVKDHVVKDCEQSTRTNWIVSNFTYTMNFRITTSLPITTQVYKLETFIWDGQYFFLSQTWRQHDTFKNFYMQMLGTEEECSKYKVTLAMQDKDGVYSNMISDHPYSMDMPETEKDVAGLRLSEKAMKTLLKPIEGVPNKSRFSVVINLYKVV